MSMINIKGYYYYYYCCCCCCATALSRVTVGCSIRDSFWNLFKKLEMLPLKSQYIFFLLLFVVNNNDQFIVNSKTDSINTKQSTNLH